MEDEERLQLGPNADWMSRLPVALHDVPLWDLAIPGSHDSMSFCLDLSSPVLGSEPRLLRVTDRLAPCWTRPCVSRWATTQTSVLTDQCDLGVRFLDLRIAKKPGGFRELFFAHGIYTLITVKEALHELSIWLDAHPQEIVIISCSHFESLSDEDHMSLVEFIIRLFGQKLCSAQEAPTLRSCWSRRQQLVVSYDDQRMALQYPQLWTGIPYWYADSSDPKKVISYLEAMKCSGRPATFYVCGLNLTENAAYVLLHPLQSMKTMTRRALSLLLRWASRQRPGDQAGGVNVLCCDFVGGSQFCSLVIGLNYKLLDPVRVETG
ncbi:PI-PLC X domain-containing protein 1-like [Takifugu flavidus]|uniref:PI-PLC X domain-containing protein 1 n=1 Tax=Takifugu flavidus TaxID=433684 RepID=A0A5C6N973_9TELE|nr:PI-PLC X domain-containing protein 1-like [Takifugu flavidus]TWW63806.1 PI-PLC X domain-containing protein 1 [Takifugu flavidus]